MDFEAKNAAMMGINPTQFLGYCTAPLTPLPNNLLSRSYHLQIDMSLHLSKIENVGGFKVPELMHRRSAKILLFLNAVKLKKN